MQHSWQRGFQIVWLVLLSLLALAVWADAQAFSPGKPACTAECPAGPPGPQGPQGPPGPPPPPPPACAPYHLDLTAPGFDFTVSALAERSAPSCAVYVVGYVRPMRAVVLIDVRGRRFQIIPQFMTAHAFTSIGVSAQALERGQIVLYLAAPDGFWLGWTWPTAALPWQAFP